MKYIIYPERQGTITASSEDANYPATNLTSNNIRKKVWKAASGVQSAILRVLISANSEAITLHKTNAETAVCAITLDSAEQTLDNAAAADEGGGLVSIPLTGHGYSAGNTIVLNATSNYDGIHTLPSQAAGDADHIIITATFAAETFAGTETACIVIESTTHSISAIDRFWENYTQQTAAHHATIELTAGSGETVEAGICKAGDLVTIGNPLASGYNETPNSYSIVDEYRSGARYTKQRDQVRGFSYSLLLAESVWDDLIDMWKYYEPDSFAMLISDVRGDDDRYCVFGRFQNKPSGSSAGPSRRKVSVSIMEAV